MALVRDFIAALLLFFVAVLVLGQMGGVGEIELMILLGIALAVLLVRHWRRP